MSYWNSFKQELRFRRRLLRKGSNEPSVYFITLHKCASSYFSRFLLPQAKGLVHVNYAAYLWNRNDTFTRTLRFKPKGFIYGPIRLSAREEMVQRVLVKPVSNSLFIASKKGVFMLRDPRDILVSSYYSFGYTHPFNKVRSRRKAQEEERARIQAMTIDEYALAHAEEQLADFKLLITMIEACEHKVVLRYEDMVHDFQLFSTELQKILSLAPEALERLYDATRPKGTIEQEHRRSGKTQAFEKELKAETIQRLNEVLEPVLQRFGYV